MSDLFNFRQYVAESGYHVLTPITLYVADSNKVEESTQVIARIDPDSRYTVFPQQHLDRNLFLKFAALEKSPDSIINFANEHGFLGVDQNATANEHPAPSSGHLLITVEPLYKWYKAIDEMARSTKLISGHRDEPNKVKKLFEWKKKGGKYWSLNFVLDEKTKSGLPVYYDLMADTSRPEYRELGKSISYADYDFAVRRFIQKAVNRIYENHVNVHMLFENSFSKIVHQITPKNLLGFMWLQLARSYEENSSYRNCKECGSPFVDAVSRGQAKEYCSNSCRYKFNRKSNA